MALAGLICGYGSLLIITGIACLVIHSIKESHRIKGEEIAEEIRRGKEIHALVMRYDADHGTFPDTLSELVKGGYTASLDNLQPLRGGNWIYFQGMSSKSSPSKYFIRSDHHKIVIYIDGTDGSRELFYTMEPTDDPVRGHSSVRD